MRVGSAAKRNKADFNLELSTPDGYNFTINADHDNYVCVGVSDDDVRSGLKTKMFLSDMEYPGILYAILFLNFSCGVEI